MEDSAKKGDIWQLGENRLACGDASDPDVVAKVVGGGKIRMVLTDPPYGIGYVENKDWLGMSGTSSKHFEKHKKIIGDQIQTNDSYAEFTTKWLLSLKDYLADYNTFYIFNSDVMMCALKEGIEKAGGHYSQMIIWVKNTMVLGRKDYYPQHELIIYGWFGHHKRERAQGKSVMFHPKPSRSLLHPTMKPVGLLRKLILNSTKIGEYVYDPFGGSGSTLIACENTMRKCLMIELEPEYCDIIIKRWKKLTGQKVKKMN